MVVVLSPVAEALAPRIPSVVGGRGPVPAGGIGTSYVKSADRGAVVKQHVQLGLRRHAPVSVAVRIELGGVFLGIVEFHRQGGIGGRGIHRLVGIRGNAGKDRAVWHLIADLRRGSVVCRGGLHFDSAVCVDNDAAIGSQFNLGAIHGDRIKPGFPFWVPGSL